MYIGKTDFIIAQRWKEHLKSYTKKCCEKRPLYDAMTKYGIENFTIEEIENCLSEQSNEREIYWIDFYKTYQNGYNATLGGDGTSYINCQQVIGLYQQYKSCPKVAAELEIHVETVRKILHSNNITIVSYASTIRKQIEMFSLSNEKLEVFDSITDAALAMIQRHGFKSTIGGATGHIIHVANGIRKTAYGYIWKWPVVN